MARYDGQVRFSSPARAERPRWRRRLHEVIFEADTPAGRGFDVGLLIAILVSVVAVILESVADIRREYGGALRAVEWVITVAFTIEYGLRLLAVDHPWRYARSFFGLVDLSRRAHLPGAGRARGAHADGHPRHPPAARVSHLQTGPLPR
jgi:ion transport protein